MEEDKKPSHDDYAWLATAILVRITLNAKLHDNSIKLINRILKDSHLASDFNNSLDMLIKSNEFNITEITENDARQIRDFVFKEFSSL